MLRVIDNKKIDLTNDEWALYLEICKSYDRPNFRGKDLFQGLFETDEKGIIVFLRPPSSKYSSMEVYMFLVNIMVHQHLGTACEHIGMMYKNIESLTKSLTDKINQADDVIKTGRLLIADLEKCRVPGNTDTETSN